MALDDPLRLVDRVRGFVDQLARRAPSAIEQEAAARRSLGELLAAYRARTAGVGGG